jgi:hypothetical protein
MTSSDYAFHRGQSGAASAADIIGGLTEGQGAKQEAGMS